MRESSSLNRFRHSIAFELTRLRRQAGLSQTALAAELGSDQSIISRVEAGARSITVDELFIWTEALGLTPTETSTLLADAWSRNAARREGFWE